MKWAGFPFPVLVLVGLSASAMAIATKVQNKSSAPIQVTAEQILRQSRETLEPEIIRPPKQSITDGAELGDHRLRKRQEFEDLLRRARGNTAAWVKYARWEASQGDLARARSVWERALQVHHRNPSLWLNYARAEIKNRSLDRARNVWDRAVALLPLVDRLWHEYARMEEMVGNVASARQVFDRWMEWRPDRTPEPRGRADEGSPLYSEYAAFVQRHGDGEGIEDAVVGKKRSQFEEDLTKNPLHYDSWFAYIRLDEEESGAVGKKERVRELYERALANVPPADEKRYWRRYIYLWINRALYEELVAGDADRTRGVYRDCLKLIPHKKFSFAKIWVMAAQFELRQKDLPAARRILGRAVGMARKDKIFDKYIEMELQLGQIDRCRALYGKYLEWAPAKCRAWCKFAQLERSLNEIERARGIFELALSLDALDMPELLWKAYIDFETSLGEYENARRLYEKLLGRTKHVRVWISYAKFEAAAAAAGGGRDEEVNSDEKRLRRSRAVFERAFSYLRTNAPELNKEETALLLEEWLNVESSFGDIGVGNVCKVLRDRLPRKVKRTRARTAEDGRRAGFEEYIDYVFPDEEVPAKLQILDAAYNWKKQRIHETGQIPTS